MNFFKKLRQAFQEVDNKEPSTITLLANGQLDKKDVDDPTAKFYVPAHAKTQANSIQRRNIIYVPSEYDLPMLANAVSLDGILRRTVNIYVEQILKNGFEINSKNDKIQKHISRRLREIEYFTGVSKYELLNQIATQLVTYGNAYVIKVRDNKASKFAKPYRLYGKNCKPIVGLFLTDASTMKVGLDQNGLVSTYKQEIRGEAREWDERDVIHFTYNKIPGTLTGQSHLIPVLDDVRALRKLEEEIEILGFQYSIPLYLYKVGTKDIPPAPGEIDQVSSSIANMPSYGMLVIPGHHDVTIPANANNVMDIIKYVDHFKSRIFGGLGVSPVAMGESGTSNRNTAQVSDMAMQTINKSYQQIIKNKLELDLFREIMLDGSFNNIEDVSELKFPEIDVETQIKIENHIISKWQNNLITREEARNEMDYETKIKDVDTFLNVIDIPKIQAQQQGQVEITKLNISAQAKLNKANNEQAAVSTKKPTTSTSTKNAKTTSNKVAPANQFGKSTRPKYVKNSNENIFSGLNIFNKDSFYKKLNSELSDLFYNELEDTINKLSEFYHKPITSYDTSIVDKFFSGFSLVLEDKINRATKLLDSVDKLDIYSIQTKSFINDQVNKIHNLAKILLYKELDVKTILITSDNCEKHSDTTIDMQNFDYTKLPPFCYQCKCDIDEEKFND